MRSLKNYENLTNTVKNHRGLLKVALQNKQNKGYKNKEKLMDCFLEDNLKALEKLAKC
ncbi:hypothetical protein [Clostridium sporogenes]|uniref:hypothetical protein n=1 Tax=Clostridium sporogenes TaxID=1509 RepID=UPI000B0B74A2|nr:hypothetical protein [Clostridium sporogenes]MDS1006449.1 hypothetical protein [Clostridium sporogenes]